MIKYLKRDKAFYNMLFSLALPIIAQNLINTSLAMFDTLMVGVLGETELAAVSLANTPFFIMNILVFGIQSGASVLISQYWGKRDTKTINRIIGCSYATAGSITFIFACLMFAFPMQIMSITSNNAAIVELAAGYARIVAFSAFFNAMALVYIGAHRSMENPRFGMVVLVVSMSVNTVLNYLLIFGKFGAPMLGVNGAAIATLISRVFEVVLVVLYMVFSKRFKVDLKAMLSPGATIFKDFARYASPVILNEALWALAVSVYPIVFGHMAESAAIVSAYALTQVVERLVNAISFGVGNAAAVIVGKEIGAGADREQVYFTGCTMMIIAFFVGLFALGIMLVSTHLLIVPHLFPLFSLSERSVAYCTELITICALFMPVKNMNFCLIVGVWRGGGDVKSSLILDLVCVYFYAVPVCIATGLFFGLPVATIYFLLQCEEFLKAVWGILRFRTKKWIKNITRDFA